MMPCFCNSDTLEGRGICPIRDFWRAIEDSDLWGQPVSPSLLKNINRVIRGGLSSLGLEAINPIPPMSFVAALRWS